MNNAIIFFLEYAENHNLGWSKSSKFMYCAGQGCGNCVLYVGKECKQVVNDGRLNNDDLIYIKEHYPEYFI